MPFTTRHKYIFHLLAALSHRPISVTLSQWRTHKWTVLGNAARPRIYTTRWPNGDTSKLGL